MSQDLQRNPVHLGLGATAVPQPPITGLEWYEGYTARTAADGLEGRLVSMYSFTAPWEMWEMHPQGAELVVCTDGEITLIQEDEGGAERRITLTKGGYAISAPGVWHTADIDTAATCLFVTAGLGTQHRSR